MKYSCSSGHKEYIWSLPTKIPKAQIESMKICPCGARGVKIRVEKKLKKMKTNANITE